MQLIWGRLVLLSLSYSCIPAQLWSSIWASTKGCWGKHTCHPEILADRAVQKRIKKKKKKNQPIMARTAGINCVSRPGKKQSYKQWIFKKEVNAEPACSQEKPWSIICRSLSSQSSNKLGGGRDIRELCDCLITTLNGEGMNDFNSALKALCALGHNSNRQLVPYHLLGFVLSPVIPEMQSFHARHNNTVSLDICSNVLVLHPSSNCTQRLLGTRASVKIVEARAKLLHK